MRYTFLLAPSICPWLRGVVSHDSSVDSYGLWLRFSPTGQHWFPPARSWWDECRSCWSCMWLTCLAIYRLYTPIASELTYEPFLFQALGSNVEIDLSHPEEVTAGDILPEDSDVKKHDAVATSSSTTFHSKQRDKISPLQRTSCGEKHSLPSETTIVCRYLFYTYLTGLMSYNNDRLVRGRLKSRTLYQRQSRTQQRRTSHPPLLYPLRLNAMRQGLDFSNSTEYTYHALPININTSHLRLITQLSVMNRKMN